MDGNKCLPKESHTQMIWKMVNRNIESLLKRQNIEDIKPKADHEQLLNDLPEFLNDLARICRENKTLIKNYECEEKQHKLYICSDGT